jgi:pimeloyl-ACP methyl ester carboxylesterase
MLMKFKHSAIVALSLPLFATAAWSTDPILADAAALSDRQSLAASGNFRQTVPTMASSDDARALARAMGVPDELLRAATLSGAAERAGVLDGLGVVRPRTGRDFTVLSTGIAGSDAPLPGTDFSAPGRDDDGVVLRLELEAPEVTSRLSFHFRLLSAEYPAFTGAGYSDRFTVMLTDGKGTREIVNMSADDSAMYPVSQSRAAGSGFDLFSKAPAQLEGAFGTGLPAAGMSDWIAVREQVHAGDPVMLEFRIRDEGDGLVDSAVVLDQFSLGLGQFELAAHGAQPAGSAPRDADILDNCVAPPVPIIVDGAVTDGETRLRIFVETPGSGDVRFTMLGAGAPADGGFIESFDSRDRLDQVVVPVVNNIGETLYLVPDDFNRGGDESSPERPLSVFIEYFPDDGSPPASGVLNGRLKRPGVVFLHGLWSSQSTWAGDFAVRQHPFLTTAVADYSNSNADHFSENQQVLDSWLAQICTDLLAEGLAMRRADVVGHSMGGLLGRLYDDVRPNLVNRLITMNTPHTGSPLANALMVLNNHPNPITRRALRAIFSAIGKSISDGAIEDLAVGSSALASLPAPDVPSHAMVGIGGGAFTDAVIDGAIAGPAWPALWLFGVRPSDLFDTPEHDLIVGRDSQIGGIGAGAHSIYDGSESLHWKVTSSAMYSNDILQSGTASLLNVPSDGPHYGRFPAPLNLQDATGSAGTPVPADDNDAELDDLFILSPADGYPAMSGESVTFELEAEPGFDIERALLASAPLSQGLGEGQSAGEFVIPLEFVGALEVTAFATNDMDRFAMSEPLVLNVAAPAPLSGIAIVTPDPTIFPFETERRISVAGDYDDGIVRDITHPSTGTVYQSSHPAVAEVSENGVIIPIDEGFTTVIASNGGFQDSITVRVLEREPLPPEVVNVSADPDELWPPNNRMVPVALIVVDDDGQPVSGCEIVAVALSEGDPDHDVEVTGALSLDLRASRSGSGNGREYTIDVDCGGSSGSAIVTVPHDQGQAIDGPSG